MKINDGIQAQDGHGYYYQLNEILIQLEVDIEEITIDHYLQRELYGVLIDLHIPNIAILMDGIMLLIGQIYPILRRVGLVIVKETIMLEEEND